MNKRSVTKRPARVVVEGVPHHITQPGNKRQDIFLVDEDRRSYIQTLRHKCQQHGLALLGYCLMTNHPARLQKATAPRPGVPE